MKTTITIEDGRVTVQVDDNAPVRVTASPPVGLSLGLEPMLTVDQKKKEPADKPTVAKEAPAAGLAKTPTPVKKCVICGEDISHLHALRKLCKKRECALEQQRRLTRKSYHRLAGHSEPERRVCVVCGDDITGSRGNRKVCQKPECKREIRRQAGYDYYSRNKDAPEFRERTNVSQQKYRAVQAVKTSLASVKPAGQEVGWCKHCQAHTTHDTSGHLEWLSKEEQETAPKQKPKKAEFLPGHEKTPEEIEQWRPKVSAPAPVPSVAPRDTEPSSFADPWNCDGCRRRSAVCPLHQSMAESGKEPPKPKGRAPRLLPIEIEKGAKA